MPRDADGQDPGIANVIDAFLTARGGKGATEDEIMALFKTWNVAQVTCGAFQLIADGKCHGDGRKEFLVDLVDGEPRFFAPAADWKPPTGPCWEKPPPGGSHEPQAASPARECEQPSPAPVREGVEEGHEQERQSAPRAPGAVLTERQFCHSGRDGECSWKDCPQLRDGEPGKSGRHCPLDVCRSCGQNCGDEECNSPPPSPPPKRRGRPPNLGPCDRCGAPNSRRDQHAKVYRCASCWQQHYEARERKEAEKVGGAMAETLNRTAFETIKSAQVETLEEQTVIEEQTPEPAAPPPEPEPTVEIDGLKVPASQVTPHPGPGRRKGKKRREPPPPPVTGSPAAEQEGWRAAKAGSPESGCPYDFDDCKRRDSWLLGHRNWHAQAGSGV